MNHNDSANLLRLLHEQLEKEAEARLRKRLDDALYVWGGNGKSAVAVTVKRRKLSAAGRAAIRAGQRARWAKHRKAQGRGNS